jgi:hypothetical protein
LFHEFTPAASVPSPAATTRQRPEQRAAKHALLHHGAQTLRGAELPAQAPSPLCRSVFETHRAARSAALDARRTTNRSRTTNGLKRTFTVTDRRTIDDLKSKMKSSKIQGLSTGTRDQLLFQERGGKSWHGSIVSKTRIDLSSTEDGWRSYCIEFADGSLVEKLLEICLHNEQKLHPKVRPENIVLLEEFLVEAYPGASPESVQVRKDLLNAYPNIEE